MNSTGQGGAAGGSAAGARVVHPAIRRIEQAMDAAMGDDGCTGDEPLTVAFGDAHLLLELLAAGTAPINRDRADYMPCDRCGHDVGLDAYVPTEVWEKISPTAGKEGALCVWCMDDLCVERGIAGPVPVHLAYEGQVISSSAPPHPRAALTPDQEPS